MTTSGGVEVYLHTFVTLLLDNGYWSASRLSRFTLWEGAHVVR